MLTVESLISKETFIVKVGIWDRSIVVYGFLSEMFWPHSCVSCLSSSVITASLFGLILLKAESEYKLISGYWNQTLEILRFSLNRYHRDRWTKQTKWQLLNLEKLKEIQNATMMFRYFTISNNNFFFSLLKYIFNIVIQKSLYFL